MMKLLQLYLLHADEHTVVLINKIKDQSLSLSLSLSLYIYIYIYTQKPKIIIKGKL